MRSGRLYFFLLTFLFLISSLNSAATAQEGIILQLAVPEFEADIYESVIDRFEAENPSITVNIVSAGIDIYFAPVTTSDIEERLDAYEAYATSADVVLMDSGFASPEATRAGYFLDLTPLINSDPTINVGDFLPAAWESFQWDMGIWAIPVSGDVAVLVYDPTAFDAAGLTYPDASWTIDDLANAARLLAQRDGAGNVTEVGLTILDRDNVAALFRSLLGSGFYNDQVTPEMPQFATPELETILTTWSELQSEGVVGGFSGSFDDFPPMAITGSFGMAMLPGANAETRVGSILPGGSTIFDARGYAVSGGTRYPEQAYTLAKFLSGSAEIANGPFSVTPARQSLIGVEVQEEPGEGQIIRFGGDFTPEAQTVLDDAILDAFPLAETRYGGYLNNALDAIINEQLDTLTALQDAETEAIADLETAYQRRSTPIQVTPPEAETVLAPGEVSLNFGLSSFVFPIPNLEQWEQLIAEFVATDPQVGEIVLDTDFAEADERTERNDCFYVGQNAVPSLDLSTILPLDPYLDADPNFDDSDLVGDVLTQVQRNNQTWALPIIIQPRVLRYHAEQFANAGVPAPENGWTIDQFNDALLALRPDPNGAAPFSPREGSGNYLLMLIAAYGGLPIDFRTNPPTINFTDPTNVDAIRQVLDLARDGYIDYQELATSQFMIVMGGEEDQIAIYSDAFGGINIRIGGAAADPYRTTTFPTGSQYSAVSYSVGTAYISANTQNADACYRWLSTIAQHPELFSGMPARRSLINDPMTVATQGEDVVEAYNQFDALMQQPNTITFPAQETGTPGDYLLQFWLYRVFDNYVLTDADLETELAEAETYVRAFQECTANIPAYDPATQTRESYFSAFANCAITVDPTTSSFFVAP